jgi:hypothetical protein
MTEIPPTLTDAFNPEIKIKIGNGNPDGKNENGESVTTPLGNIVTTKVDVTTYGN